MSMLTKEVIVFRTFTNCFKKSVISEKSLEKALNDEDDPFEKSLEKALNDKDDPLNDEDDPLKRM